MRSLPRTIRQILRTNESLPQLTNAYGHIEFLRRSKAWTFLEINDGTTSSRLQAIIPTEKASG